VTRHNADIRALGEEVGEKYRADLEPMSSSSHPVALLLESSIPEARVVDGGVTATGVLSRQRGNLNPLSKLFRNCLKTEIESLKRISRVFERNGAFFS
jgi:hypothetical protein